MQRTPTNADGKDGDDSQPGGGSFVAQVAIITTEELKTISCVRHFFFFCLTYDESAGSLLTAVGHVCYARDVCEELIACFHMICVVMLYTLLCQAPVPKSEGKLFRWSRVQMK